MLVVFFLFLKIHVTFEAILIVAFGSAQALLTLIIFQKLRFVNVNWLWMLNDDEVEDEDGC